jgi:hypothetical protein
MPINRRHLGHCRHSVVAPRRSVMGFPPATPRVTVRQSTLAPPFNGANLKPPLKLPDKCAKNTGKQRVISYLKSIFIAIKLYWTVCLAIRHSCVRRRGCKNKSILMAFRGTRNITGYTIPKGTPFQKRGSMVKRSLALSVTGLTLIIGRISSHGFLDSTGVLSWECLVSTSDCALLWTGGHNVSQAHEAASVRPAYAQLKSARSAIDS